MKRFRTVLCPMDFTPLSQRTLEIAASLCARVGARLVLHHNEGPRPPDFLSVKWMWSEEHPEGPPGRQLDVSELFQQLFSTLPPEIDCEAKVTRGPLEKGLLYLAKELPADLIVMGSHGWSSPEHRSVTEQVILRAPCTVLTTGEQWEADALFSGQRTEDPEALTVLVAVDSVEGPQPALDFGLSLTERMPHRLTVLHALKPREGNDERRLRRDIEKAREKLRLLIPDRHAERIRSEVVHGRPGEEILRVATEREALFVLMGAKRKSLLKRSLARGTSLEVLHGCKCPVWFVPPDRERQQRRPVS